MRQFKHIGAYGLIIKDEQIVLIKKVGGPYSDKLDLPLPFGPTIAVIGTLNSSDVFFANDLKPESSSVSNCIAYYCNIYMHYCHCTRPAPKQQKHREVLASRCSFISTSTQ